jgi:hypothetical protein
VDLSAVVRRGVTSSRESRAHSAVMMCVITVVPSRALLTALAVIRGRHIKLLSPINIWAVLPVLALAVLTGMGISLVPLVNT